MKNSRCQNTFTPHLHSIDITFYQFRSMEKTGTFDVGLWCFSEDAGDNRIFLPPFPCKKEACPRYQKEFPYCVMMSRFYSHERDYP